MRTVCGLDVHKDSVYLCILSSTGEIYEKKFGVLTTELIEMRDLMLSHHVLEAQVCIGFLFGEFLSHISS